MNYAVIKTGGKQYVVRDNQALNIEKIEGETGDKIQFDTVLLVSDDEAKAFELGQPTVKSKIVSAEILEQGRADKIRVTHYKNKTRYHKVYGHRQPFTKVKITKVGAGAVKAEKAEKAVEKKPVAKKAEVKKTVAKKTTIAKKK